MSESLSPRTTPEDEASVTGLVSRVTAAVVATPGVARLVPGLKSALARLRRSAGSGAAADGVTVVEEGGALRVTVDIAVRPSAVVVDTARAVRAAAQSVVGSAHDGPSVVRVNVLAWEPERQASSEASSGPLQPPREEPGR